MKIESEKLLDKKLCAEVKKLGGWAIKIPASHLSGLPDRLCLLPEGRLFFAEIKTTGKKPTRLQLSIHKRLRDLGFRVYTINRSEVLHSLIDYLRV
jgi:hypothetical protein